MAMCGVMTLVRTENITYYLIKSVNPVNTFFGTLSSFLYKNINSCILLSRHKGTRVPSASSPSEANPFLAGSVQYSKLTSNAFKLKVSTSCA